MSNENDSYEYGIGIELERIIGKLKETNIND